MAERIIIGLTKGSKSQVLLVEMGGIAQEIVALSFKKYYN